MDNKLIVPPDPRRMIEGLRDTGYNFNTAVADLVDNSIAAKATLIHINIEMDFGGAITLSIIDNGTGMNYEGLINAMKYGSPQRRSKRSLGKFGLGLKTASTSFCRRLEVITRDHKDGKVYKAAWDLDHVVSVGNWELLILTPDQEEIDLLDSVAAGTTGTMVRWKKVDRLIKKYTDPGGKAAHDALKRKIVNLQDHLSMVFERFLDPNDCREPHKVKIYLNGEELKPWSPFLPGISDLVAEKTVPVCLDESDEIIGAFTVRAFILPRREEFSDPNLLEAAKISNKNQGIYIYRENRLIHSADWLGMTIKEPHLSLLRVEFSFNAELDDALHVDIKKSRIDLDDTLYNWLNEEFLPAPRRAANERYRRGQRKNAARKSETAHAYSNRGIKEKEKDINKANVRILDPENQEVQVENSYGATRLKLKLTNSVRQDEVYVQPVESIDDGVLWQPALIDGHQGLQLNTGHPFYQKVYLPNISSQNGSSVNVQAIDYLFWALSVAELKSVNDNNREHFDEMRYEVSRILRKLVEMLPDPVEDDEK